MDLKKLADYHIWANDRAREIIRGLSEEEFTRDTVPPFGSVKRLCVHMVLAIEYNLHRRVHGEAVDPYEMDDALDAMSVDELMTRWRIADLRLRDYALGYGDHVAVFPNFLGEGEMEVGHGDYFIQYLIHTAYHRAQVMSAMRALGREGVGTDYLFYLSNLASQTGSPSFLP
jgi:uncharacterized damage-inducible protein DinB